MQEGIRALIRRSRGATQDRRGAGISAKETRHEYARARPGPNHYMDLTQYLQKKGLKYPPDRDPERLFTQRVEARREGEHRATERLNVEEAEGLIFQLSHFLADEDYQQRHHPCYDEAVVKAKFEKLECSGTGYLDKAEVGRLAVQVINYLRKQKSNRP